MTRLTAVSLFWQMWLYVLKSQLCFWIRLYTKAVGISGSGTKMWLPKPAHNVERAFKNPPIQKALELVIKS